MESYRKKIDREKERNVRFNFPYAAPTPKNMCVSQFI